jgi:hypothetical protein
MRRLLLAVVAVASGFVLMTSPPASAETPHGAWTDPSPSAVYDGTPLAYLDEEQPLRGFAEFSQGVRSVEFKLLEDAADQGDECSAAGVVEPQSVDGGAERVDFAFDAPFPCNRRYAVRATAFPTDRPLRDDTELELDLWVAVAIPPATTTGLTATELTGDSRGVQLEWDTVTREPDFKGYLVRRAVDDGDFADLEMVDSTASTFTDHVVPHDGGVLRYKVIGMRSGPDPGSTVFAKSGPTAKTTVSPYVPPTTEAGGGGGDGDGGGAGGPSSSIQVTGNAAPRTVTRTIPRRTQSTIDTGFEQTLPFQRPEPEPEPVPAPPTGGNAIANLSDDDGGSTRRQSMLLVAGGTTTLSWALVLRYLTRRALTY